MTDQDRKIRERAHAIWEREGRPDGRDHDHWLLAEQEVAGEADAATPQAPGAAAKAKRSTAKPPAADKAEEKQAKPKRQKPPSAAQETAATARETASAPKGRKGAAPGSGKRSSTR